MSPPDPADWVAIKGAILSGVSSYLAAVAAAALSLSLSLSLSLIVETGLLLNYSIVWCFIIHCISSTVSLSDHTDWVAKATVLS